MADAPPTPAAAPAAAAAPTSPPAEAASSPKSQTAASPQSPASHQSGHLGEGTAELHAAVAAAAPVVVDDAPADADSTYNSTIGSASFQTSLASSVMNYKYENGRRYHAYREGTYVVPNDEEEQDRMDLAHHIYLMYLEGELFRAPIKEPHRVLDIGTGTGIWAMDFADAYPSAEVIGTDLSPIQPGWIPPNCSFEVDDFEEDWPQRRPFDFINARELEGCISDTPKLLRQIYNNLVPGGYTEINMAVGVVLSDDNSMEKAPFVEEWIENLVKGMEKFGKPITAALTLKKELEAAGFVDINQEVFKMPIGPWPKDKKLKEIGQFQTIQQVKAVESYTPALFTRVLGWTEEEVQVLIAKVRKEMLDPATHIYVPVYLTYARKPE